MNILLLGHNGYLGSYLYESLNVDILPNREIVSNGKKYNYVINCIGKADVNYCEQHPNQTNYSNRDVIIDIQKFFPNSKIINFSSYYVYNDDGLCSENSNTTEQYNYTRQKLQAESLIKNGVTYRLGKLFGHKNLKIQHKLTEHIITSDELFVDNIFFNPTSLEQVLKVVHHELKNSNFYGVYNLANDGITTHYEYAVCINEFMNTHKKITLVDSFYPDFVNYGKFLMSCEKIKKEISLNDWKTDLFTYIRSL